MALTTHTKNPIAKTNVVREGGVLKFSEASLELAARGGLEWLIR